MNIQSLLKRTTKVLSDNSSVILTGAAVAGTVTTAIFSAKGHLEAHRVVEGHRIVNDGVAEDIEPKKRLELTWKCYIPAAVSGTTTIACIIGIHSVNTRKQAALISAYSVMDKTFNDYREKVAEVAGKNQEEKVRDEVARKQVTENPVGTEVYLTGSGDQLCYDSLTGRYFKSDIETLRKAQNDINQQIIGDMYASQNEFYEKIGLAPAQVGEEVGWTTDRFMDISFASQLTEDGKPCLVLNYIPGPIRAYWKVG